MHGTIIPGVETNQKIIWNVVWIGMFKRSVNEAYSRGLMLRDSLRNLGYDAEKVREEMKKGNQKKDTEK